ncbi:MAG TPA: sulfatase-like hydrolase/transferase [Terriglobales bacterium]|nr:sulfatase-like hydrolase/transferase [Terriglobales bacterium]
MSLRRSLVCFLLLGCSFPSLAATNNVILITLDTTRADRMGFLGSKRGLTPNLDALARQCIVFSRAYSQVPLTTPSHATILTGTYPQFNHLQDMGNPLARDLPYLPDILRQHGYHTAAFVGSQILDPKSVAAPGFDRGFEVYDAGFHSRAPGEDRYQSVERRAAVVVARAIAWLNQGQRSPFFLWVHLYDPHDPYDPPEPFKAKYRASPYDGEIAYTDFAVGKLLAAIHTKGLDASTVIAVAADHGEAFGEHGEETHGLFLYDETIHVPLLMKLAVGKPALVRVDTRVGLVDLAPTILQAVGITPPTAMQGQSLMESLRPDAQRATADHPAYAETDYPYRAFGWSPLRAWRAGKYLFVEAPQRELYDQVSDPGASRNVAGSSPAVADTMASQLDAFHHKTSSAAPAQAGITPDQEEQLQALGYITSEFQKSGQSEIPAGPDPKGKVRIANLLHQGLLDVDDERYKAAIPRLQEVLKDQPNVGLANLELGRAWNALGNYPEALPWLRKAVELTPESGRAHYELGVALAETGDWAGAAAQLEIAVAHAPDSDDMLFYLGMAYDELGRAAEAARSLERALQINPNHYRANLLLGRLLGMQDRPAEALPYLQRAVKLQPKSPDAHKFLGNVYTEMGQAENARRELMEARRLQDTAKP